MTDIMPDINQVWFFHISYHASVDVTNLTADSAYENTENYEFITFCHRIWEWREKPGDKNE